MIVEKHATVAVGEVGRRATSIGIGALAQQDQHAWDAEQRRLQGEVLPDQDEDSTEEAEGLATPLLRAAPSRPSGLRVEAFGEPVVDGLEEVAGIVALAIFRLGLHS